MPRLLPMVVGAVERIWGRTMVGDIDPVAAHRAAVEAGDWDRARELERELIAPTDNTERPEDGEQPSQEAGGEGS